MGMRIVGLGRQQASGVLTNDMLGEVMDTSDEWIRTRTGIGERRVASDGETTATLGAAAARHALDHAGRSSVDVIIVATTTPDTPCPSTASWIQAELGLTGGAFDLNAACSGWVYGLVVANGLLHAATADSALVIGAETLTRFIDPEDRGTRPLFGDAAGAVVVERTNDRGEILACDLGNDGTLADLIILPAGGSRLPPSADTVDEGQHYFKMAGREVFRVASGVILETCSATLERAGLDVSDVDVFVPHQANARIITYACEKLGIPAEKTIVNIERYGNTSAASVPVALSEAYDDGRIIVGDKVLLAGFGAGMSWASVLLDWSLAS